MNIEQRLAALEAESIRARRERDNDAEAIIGLVTKLMHSNLYVANAAAAAVTVLAEVAPTQVAKHRQSLALVAQSSPEIDAAFAKFLHQLQSKGE